MTTQNMYTSGWMVLILIISISISTSSARDIDKYTEDKVGSAWTHVMGYSRRGVGNGIIEIKYYTIPGKHLHWFSIPSFGLVSLGVGIADGVIAANPTWSKRYFKEDTGELLSMDLESARRILADREQAAKDQVAKEAKAAREQAARVQAAREQAARVQAAREQAARVQAARVQAARDQAARDEAVKETVRKALIELRNLAGRLHQQGRGRLVDGQVIVNDNTADNDDREEANRHFDEALRLFEQTTHTQESLKQLIDASKQNGNIDIVNRAIGVLVKYYKGTQHLRDSSSTVVDSVRNADSERTRDVVIQQSEFAG